MRFNLDTIKEKALDLFFATTGFLLRIWDKIKQLAKAVKAKNDEILNIAMPEPEKKYAFYGLYLFVVIMLAYIIAVLNLGIWRGTFSPFSLFWEYLTTDASFMWGTWFLICVVLYAAALFYIMFCNGGTGRGFSLSKNNVYGNAREITEEELRRVADIFPKEAAMGTILGQLDLTEQRLISIKPNANSNGNMLIFGSPGSGKTFSYVINFILQAIRRRESVICTDSKGDLWAETVETARMFGYIVKRVDLKSPEYSCGWDILGELQFNDDRALSAAKAIMKNTGNDKDIHAAAEESLLRALMLYVERSPHIPPEEKTLYNAFSQMFGGMESLEKLFAAIKNDMRMKVASDAFSSFQGSPNLKGNTVSQLANRLNTLTMPAIQRLTSTKDIDLTLPGRQPCIYYINISDTNDNAKFLSSLFFTFAYLDLIDFADRKFTRKLPVKTNFLIEEAANIGLIPDLTQKLNTSRSRGIDIQLTFQNIGQIRNLYGEDYTNSILSACATHACYGFNDEATAKYYEWRSGEATVEHTTEQHRNGELTTLGNGYSKGDGRRYYYNSNELMKMEERKVFISFQRQDCKIVDTFGMNRHPMYLNGSMTTISTATHIPLSCKKAREFLNQKEAERVARYNQWVKDGGDPWPGYTTPKKPPHGPASGTPIPEIIPYPELERMALEYSREQGEISEELLIELLREPVTEEEQETIQASNPNAAAQEQREPARKTETYSDEIGDDAEAAPEESEDQDGDEPAEETLETAAPPVEEPKPEPAQPSQAPPAEAPNYNPWPNQSPAKAAPGSHANKPKPTERRSSYSVSFAETLKQIESGKPTNQPAESPSGNQYHTSDYQDRYKDTNATTISDSTMDFGLDIFGSPDQNSLDDYASDKTPQTKTEEEKPADPWQKKR